MSTNHSELADRLALGVKLARRAGDLTLEYFQTDRFAIDTKRDGSAVTTADREAEKLLRKAITESFPDDAILGEEFGEMAGTSGYKWLLDPIDGTASFVCGVPLYGTLVGIERDGESVAGVVHMPALDEVVYGGRGLGAWHLTTGRDPAPARVSKVDSLGKSVVCCTGFEYFARAGREDLFMKLATRCGKYRGWSDCYAHVLIATGRIEAVVEPTIHPWDVAASIAVITEAGGRYTDFQGKTTAYSSSGIFTNGAMHEELLGIVDSTRS